MKILYLIAICLFLVGCNAQKEGSDNTQRNKNEPITVKNSTTSTDKSTRTDIADNLVALASRVPSVKHASAVVFGNYAIVGIDIDGNIDRSQVGTIKYAVTESLKNDPHGANAVVVADPDINARLKEIGQDIKNGNPGQGIANELGDIVGRIMPDTPNSNNNQNNTNDATENQKNQLNKNQQKQLEKQQENQTNGKK